MNNRYFFFITTITTLLLFSCSDDPSDPLDPDNEYAAVNQWIENTMRDNYLWYKEIPKKPNTKIEPQSFFLSLLSTKDGKQKSMGRQYYSYMESSNSTLRAAGSDANLSLGFEYAYYYININKLDKYALKVLYMLPDSPAAKSELKRGEWIFTVNGEPISDDIVMNLNNGTTKTLGISSDPSSEVTKEVTLRPEIVEDNPVFFHKVYHRQGRRIAYLIYNHFTQGKNDRDETYNNALRKVFSDFKKEMPTDFILDLRYNGGGVITSAQLLATMLAPAEALEDVFCKTTYNDKQSSRNYTYKFDTKYMQQGVNGANLDLKRLYVITSERTASASEAVINGLKPFLGDNLIIIGEKTEGKNVGSISFEDKRFEWILHPIVCSICNKNDESDYANGFVPKNDKFIQTEPNYNLVELGDENEYLLNFTLNQIAGINAYNTEKRSVDVVNTHNLKYISSSLDRKKTNGVLIK